MRDVDVNMIGERLREAVQSLNFHTPELTFKQL